MTTEQTTGTTPPDDGDAAAQTPTTGTPSGDGRDAASGEPDYKAMYLESKNKVEEANRLKAEIEELRARSQPPPAADEDDDVEPEPRRKVDWDQVEDLARRGDAAAAAALEMRAMNAELVRNVRDSFHLRDIPDSSERQEVLRHFTKNRHRLGDVKAAEAEVRSRKLDAEVDRLRKELELARKQPPTDVVRTHSREVSASEAKTRKMTYEDFDREKAALEAQGRFSEARKLGEKVLKGEIELP